ncbi:hypothetical protein C7G41_36745 [Bradyrhizobium sp. MOS002]|jgi:hypothetical protein|nr:hypothetical protein C7G41_36745 [Bradyrhizobium sp. MOS002]
MPLMMGGLSGCLHREEKQMIWIILSWAFFAFVLFALSVYAWRNLFKTERVVRPYIDDIPFRPNRYRLND